MSDHKCAQSLVKTAESDIRALQGMSDPDFFSDAVIGFHAQQAAEKLLKAWIAAVGLVFPLTHDLGRLLTALGRQVPNTERFRGLVDLNPYNVQLRYEWTGEETEPVDRDRLLKELRVLRDCVQEALRDPDSSS